MNKVVLLAALAFALVAVVMAKRHHHKAEMADIELAPLSDAMIKHVNSVQKNWVAGHNKYWEGKSMAHIKGLMGTRLNGPKLPEKHIEVANSIPATFDARTAWPNCQSIQQIRDQGACGSCWAFGAVEAMSDRICIASKGAKQVEISAEELVSCCDSCGDGCDGGFPESAWQYFKSSGLVTGFLYNDTTTCQPYSIPPCNHHDQGRYQPCGDIVPTPRCEHTCQPGYNVSFANDKHYGSSAYSVSSNVAKIQTEIMTNGPVEGAFTVYADFLTYKSGVYHHTAGSMLGGHAIKILGWGTQGGVDYWLCANSWNSDWGNNGYFLIKRGNDECGIESGIVAGLVKV